MKKLLLIATFVAGGMGLKAQTLDDVTEQLKKQQYKEAKASIDKYLADAKNSNNADAWYYKGRAYNSLSYDATVAKPEAYQLKVDAYDAFKKNQQLDPKEIRMKSEMYSSYLDLYFGLFDLGATQFNAKNYDLAYDAFRKALEVKDFILAKQYTYTQAKLYPLDTALVLNTAITATQLKKDDEALKYYTKLTSANVSGKDYEDVYMLVAEAYAKKNDLAQLTPFLAKAKSLYPGNDYWNELELKQLSTKGDKTALYAKYDELIAANPSSFSLPYNYSIEMYNSLYGQDEKPADIAATQAKLTETLKKAIANDKGIEASVLMSNHLFNNAAEYSSKALQIKGTKPEDLKKKAELKAVYNKKMDEFIPYAESVVAYYDGKDNLKATQKATYQNVLVYLSDVYNAKGDAKKAAEYDKKRSAIKF